MKSVRLSHSAMQKYTTCPRLYYLHYAEGLREDAQSSNLIFGTAMDVAIGELLKTKLEGYKGQIIPPYTAFMQKWFEYALDTTVTYSKKDYAPNLVSSEETTDDGERPHHWLCWLSLARKAQYMIEAFETEVMPRIKRVIAIQKEVSLVNDVEDSVVGFIDLIAELDDGKIYVLDVKTAADFSRYGPLSVKTSEQLAIYGFSEDIIHVGFLVISKDVKNDGRIKNSPIKAKVRIVLDDIVPEFQNDVIHAFGLVTADIKAGKFVKNLNACSNQYGRPCAMFNLCHKGSMEGLYKKEVK